MTYCLEAQRIHSSVIVEKDFLVKMLMRQDANIKNIRKMQRIGFSHGSESLNTTDFYCHI